MPFAQVSTCACVNDPTVVEECCDSCHWFASDDHRGRADLDDLRHRSCPLHPLAS